MEKREEQRRRRRKNLPYVERRETSKIKEEKRKRERENRGSRRIKRRRKENRLRSSWRAQVRAACGRRGGKMDPCWVIYSGPVGWKGAALSPRRTP